MGSTRFPKRATIVAAAIAALLITSIVIVMMSTSNACTANTFIPGDRDMPEDPVAVVKKDDLARAFGAKFRKYQENRVDGQGVQSNFTETNGTFTLSVSEVKGDQAAAAWQRLTTAFSYADAPDIGPQTKFQKDLMVAAYKNDVYVSVILTGCTNDAPKDGRALRELGALIHQRTQD